MKGKTYYIDTTGSTRTLVDRIEVLRDVEKFLGVEYFQHATQWDCLLYPGLVIYRGKIGGIGQPDHIHTVITIREVRDILYNQKDTFEFREELL